MNLSPRYIAIATLGVGVFTFGALLTETRGAGLFDWQANAQSAPAPQAAISPLSTSDTLHLAQAVPADAPMAPTLGNPGPARPDRLVEADMTPDAQPEVPLSPFGLPCGLTVAAEPMAAAMVGLDIMDPCQPNARVVIEHSGLNLTGQTDVVGLLSMDIPVFEAPAFFTVRMPDGTSASALAPVSDLNQFHRVGVQWTEDRSLELHAMEFGATYGEAGHIWAENPGTPDRAVAGEGGFLSYIGDADVPMPMLAQIYSFPRDAMQGAGLVSLSIETPVTEANCAQDTLARTLETEEDGRVAVIELTFTLPACDAVGDYLVLQNLLQDLRVATN